MRTTSGLAIVGAASLFVGLMVGMLLQSPVAIKREITAGELVNAVVTVLVAAAVADFLSRRATNQRVEKDLLLQDVETLQTKLVAIRDLARRSRSGTSSASTNERREVLILFGDASNAIADLSADLSLCSRSVGRIDLQELKDALLRYKAALTGGAFPSQELDDFAYLESERKLTVLRRAAAKVRFDLNRR